MKKAIGWCLIGSLVAAFVLVAFSTVGARERGRPNDRVLSRVTFIHFRRGHAKPPWVGGGNGGGGGGKKQDECHYAYISRGARWRTIEDFVVNPTNGHGLTDEFVEDSVVLALDEWESYGGEIFGDLLVDDTASFNDGDLDGENTLSFGTLDPRIIAVSSVWGYFGGPPRWREIIEADILFNNDAFDWGDVDVDGETVMDLLNIATHEVGHCAGMADLYEAGADLETMFGYSDEGETNKRDLYTGDITGITKLYQ